MKTLAFILLLAAASQQINADLTHDFREFNLRSIHEYLARGLGDKFKGLLEDLRNIMKTGNSTMGIPRLDPLEAEHQEFDFEFEESLQLAGSVDDAHVTGLSDYTVQNADFRLVGWNVTADLLWREFNAETKYDINGMIANTIPIYGAGKFNILARGFRFATMIKLNVNATTRKVSIKNVYNTVIGLEELQVKITGLFNEDELSEFISAVVSDMAPDFVKDYQEEITTGVNKFLQNFGNLMLDQFTLDDIMKLIS